MLKYFIFTLILLPFSSSAYEWQSGSKQVQLVELYTSEGCSSCPPADRWLSNFKTDPKLFEEIIPIAFHVDYWDYIGWKDPFASEKHSKRQRDYVREGHLSQVYTPGFVISNKEWRGWFSGKTMASQEEKVTGELTASLDEGSQQLKVSYSDDQQAVLNVAYLGMGLKSNIRAGENRNKQLNHDFVALNYFTKLGRNQWELSLPQVSQKGQERTALVVWLSNKNTKEIIQATGGYLN